MMICVWRMMDDCSVTSKFFLLQLDFFFFGSTNDTSIFIIHGILVIVQCQRTSSEAACCHYCSLCTFNCTFWSYQYFVEEYPVYVITFFLKYNLQVVSHMGIFWYRTVCNPLSPVKWFQMNFLSFVWSYMFSTLA